MSGTFNRAMLEVARSAQGFTQSELAKAAGVTQALISKLESGITVDPMPETVAAIAAAVMVPIEFLVSGEKPHGMPQFHYRKRAKLGRKALDKIEAQINIRRIHAARLFRSYELEADKFPAIDLDSKGWSAREAAQHIRGLWLVPRGPIDNLTEVIERSGAVIIHFDFETKLLDALSFRLPGLPPLIFMNADMPGERYRFTLAHEIAHLILHNSPETDENMEAQADEFAGELLMPAKEIRPYLASPSLGSLARVKPYWKVSIKALIYQSFAQKMVTPNQYRGLMVNYSKTYSRGGEAFPIPVEQPTTLKAAVNYHFAALNYNTQEIASLLMMLPEQFAEIYTERPRLRVVS